MQNITIMIVEDERFVRNGFKQLLESVPGMSVLCEASNGHEALLLLERQQVDVVLMDIWMPLMDGIKATAAIRSRWPETGVIALTNDNQPYSVKKMVDAGARGYLLKDFDSEQIIEAVQKVAKGKTYFGKDEHKNLLTSPPNYQSPLASAPHPDQLSPREKTLLHLVANEFSPAEIAEKLGEDEAKIEKEQILLKEKIGARGIAGLVRYAMAYGLALSPFIYYIVHQ